MGSFYPAAAAAFNPKLTSLGFSHRKENQHTSMGYKATLWE